MNKTTIVTGLWDIKRGELSEGWSRSYEQYLDKFAELLRQKGASSIEVIALARTPRR